MKKIGHNKEQEEARQDFEDGHRTLECSWGSTPAELATRAGLERGEKRHSPSKYEKGIFMSRPSNLKYNLDLHPMAGPEEAVHAFVLSTGGLRAARAIETVEPHWRRDSYCEAATVTFTTLVDKEMVERMLMKLIISAPNCAPVSLRDVFPPDKIKLMNEMIREGLQKKRRGGLRRFNQPEG